MNKFRFFQTKYLYTLGELFQKLKNFEKSTKEEVFLQKTDKLTTCFSYARKLDLDKVKVFSENSEFVRKKKRFPGF